MLEQRVREFLRLTPELAHYIELRAKRELDPVQTAYRDFINRHMEGLFEKLAYLVTQKFMAKDIYEKRMAECEIILKTVSNRRWDLIVIEAEKHAAIAKYKENVKKLAGTVLSAYPIAIWIVTGKESDRPEWYCPGWFAHMRQCRKKAVKFIRKIIPVTEVPDLMSLEMVQRLVKVWPGIEAELLVLAKKEMRTFDRRCLFFGPTYIAAAELLGLDADAIILQDAAQAAQNLKQAYRQRIRACHPDLAPANTDTHDMTCQINNARDLILNGMIPLLA